MRRARCSIDRVSVEATNEEKDRRYPAICLGVLDELVGYANAQIEQQEKSVKVKKLV